MLRHLLIMAAVLLALPSATAFGQEVSDDVADVADDAAPAASLADELMFPGDGELVHGVTTTARFIYMPDFILGSFFDDHASHWDPRANLALGGQYYLRKVNSWELHVSAFWNNISMPSQFWLESGKTADAADYTRFGLSVLTLETTFMGSHDFIKEVGIFYGGGLWVGGIFGDVEKANIVQECADEVDLGLRTLESCPSDGFFETETAIPRIVGMLSANLGFRFHLSDHIVARLEGGYQGWFFGGLSLGAEVW